jgi:hypothetical protein
MSTEQYSDSFDYSNPNLNPVERVAHAIEEAKPPLSSLKDIIYKTGLSEIEVLVILESLIPKRVRRSPARNTSGGELYAAASRPVSVAERMAGLGITFLAKRTCEL